MMTEPNFCASWIASADLPLAVAPLIIIGFDFRMYVATIVANRKKRNLTARVLEQFSDELKASKTGVIVEGIAADIFFEDGSKTIDNEHFDVFIQPAATRHKKLIVCDMESTIIENEFLDEIADVMGVKEKVADITARAMNGELNFEEAMEERVKIVSGLPESEVRALIRTRLQYNDGAHELLSACKKNGVFTMLVSGGFTMFTDHVKRELGYDEAHANILLFENGRLSGVHKPILGKEAKLDFMQKKSAELGFGVEYAAAIGDGANDLPMLHAAGLGVGYMAKPKVKQEIKNQINHSDLMALAYAIGLK